MTNEPMSERDKQLYKLAKKRVAFRRHLFTYLIVNAFLWAVWLFGHDAAIYHGHYYFPWPLWCTLGWGLGLGINYYSVYHGDNLAAVDKEYEKLKDRDSRR